MSQMQYDPRNWLDSLLGALEDYVKNEINNYIKSGSTPVGLNVYSVVFDFPAADAQPVKPDLTKTIIHFVIDDISNRRLGMGDNITKVNFTEPTGGTAGSYTREEAGWHEINFDVGIWASDVSGGETNRRRAYQMLTHLFDGEDAKLRMKQVTGGVEILSFSNGRFAVDTLADVRVFRVIGAELVLRVFSSKLLAEPVIFTDDIVQSPGLTIGGEPITP